MSYIEEDLQRIGREMVDQVQVRSDLLWLKLHYGVGGKLAYAYSDPGMGHAFKHPKGYYIFNDAEVDELIAGETIVKDVGNGKGPQLPIALS